MNFDQAFALVIDVEKGLSMDPRDPGNWTGGKIGVGTLKGSKYGISSKAFPNEDIQNLTLDRAKELAKTLYWDRFNCDKFPGQIAYNVFDTAYNGGHPIIWLQQIIGAKVDGVVGDETITKANAADVNAVVAIFNSLRSDYITELGDDWWLSQGRGVQRRINKNTRITAKC